MHAILFTFFLFHTGVFQTAQFKMCGARYTRGECNSKVAELCPCRWIHSPFGWIYEKVNGKIPVLNYLSTMPWRHMGEWRYSCTILLDLGTRWRWVISFTPQPLYPWGKRSWYPLDRRLGGPESLSGCCREEKNLFLVGIWTLAVSPVTQCYTSWAFPTPGWTYNLKIIQVCWILILDQG
jgi:hypothetical protein